MTERSFLDSNILLYADDAGSGAKQDRAIALVETGFRTGRGVLYPRRQPIPVVAPVR